VPPVTASLKASVGHGCAMPADWYADDPALARFLALHLDEATRKAAEPFLGALGQDAPARLDAWARDADRQRPRTVARGQGLGGQDTVHYPASYEALRRAAREHRAFTASWHPLGRHARAPRVVHFALGYLYAQAESGYYCPGCMTDGAAVVLQRHAPPALREHYLPRLVQDAPDGAFEGAMLLTEKTGGSDVGSTRTEATPRPDGTWTLHGDKYFASNCTAEVILTLARLPGGAPGTQGLGLFLVPRVLPDGRPNQGILLPKLKDKLGVTSMATAELEFRGATAFLLEGGFKAMAGMVNVSRLYNAVASVAVARRALRLGVEHGRAREAFGKPLREHALYRLRLTVLALEVEGALALVLDAAHAMDRADAGEAEAARLLRATTPLAKLCTARLAVRAASEACEFLGGEGYVEDASVAPRLLRDAQVLPIWEGTGNIQALDFLRAAAREGALPALHGHVEASLREAADEPALGPAVAALRTASQALAREPFREVAALRLAEAHFHLLAAALLARAAARAPPDARARAVRVAEGYAAWKVAPAGDAGQRALEALAADPAAGIAR
jgi:acyl-CoA dehydrogenase